MTDQTPHTPGSGLPPVRMALRVIGRHGHRGGPHLARAVVDARAPKHLASSTRLSRHAAAAPEAPPAAQAWAPAPAPSEAPPAAASLVPGVDRPIDPSLSDFASEFLFGDAGSATSALTPMSQAEKMSDTGTAKEARLARRRARGALDVSRAAKILEGPSSGAPASAEETSLPDVAAAAGPVSAPAPAVKVSRTPADAPKPPNAPIPLPKPPEEPPPAAASADPAPPAPSAAPAEPAPRAVARSPRADAPAPPAPGGPVEDAAPRPTEAPRRLARAARRAPSAP